MGYHFFKRKFPQFPLFRGRADQYQERNPYEFWIVDQKKKSHKSEFPKHRQPVPILTHVICLHTHTTKQNPIFLFSKKKKLKNIF